MAARTALLLALLGLAAAEAAAPADPGEEPAVDAGRFHRLSEFVRAYAARKGLAAMTDEDIRCLLQLGDAVRSDTQHHAAVQPAVTLYGMVMDTTPRCKVRLVTKARLFLAVDFAKGVFAILLNQDLGSSPLP